MTLYIYRYYVAFGEIKEFEESGYRETGKAYTRENTGERLLKSDEDKPVLKSRTSYPFIDIFSREKIGKKAAAQKILDFLRNEWGLETT